MKRLAALVIVSVALICDLPLVSLAQDNNEPFKIGWISPITGPASKYGAHQAAEIAVEDVNAAGGILGRPLKLIMEDGKCEAVAAVTAMNKLINIDGVKYVLGGHCPPESVNIAGIAERNKIIQLSSISTSPSLTNAGDYVFRTSPVNTRQCVLMAEYALKNGKQKKFGMIFEETPYALPIAEVFGEEIKRRGGEVISSDSFVPGNTDFRSMLIKLRGRHADGVLIAVQAQDTAYIIVRQLHELGLKIQVYGNEVAGNAITAHPEAAALFEGMIFGEPEFNQDDPALKDFIAKFNARFGTTELPYGFWTAESYDGVRLLAKVINECGDDVEAVKKCLYGVNNYKGISGKISINENGDGVRNYIIKRVTNGRIQ